MNILLGLALVCQFAGCQLFRRGQGVGSVDFHIRFYSCSFPVTFRNRVDRPREGNANGEVVPRRYASHRMSAAARDFTHDGCALLRLQIEGKLLTSGKGSVRGEDIHRFIDETLSRNPGECPVLVGLITSRAVRSLIWVGCLKR